MSAAKAQSHSGVIPFSLNSPSRLQNAKLHINGVSKRYGSAQDGVQALQRIDIAVELKDFICIVGPSGCGKSTLLNIVAGFEKASEGQVILDGRPIDKPGFERGVVFQQGALFEWMTVRENVAFGPRACGKGAREAVARANDYLDLVGLSGFADRFPYELSGGMQQRVGIARALANDPEVLLMDEPLAALDQQTKELLQEEIKRIWQKTGKTILWITHSIEEALFLATHLIVMSARPGHIKASFKTCFDPADPELTTSDTFFHAKRELFHVLRDETLASRTVEQLAHG